MNVNSLLQWIILVSFVLFLFERNFIFNRSIVNFISLISFKRMWIVMSLIGPMMTRRKENDEDEIGLEYIFLHGTLKQILKIYIY